MATICHLGHKMTTGSSQLLSMRDSSAGNVYMPVDAWSQTGQKKPVAPAGKSTNEDDLPPFHGLIPVATWTSWSSHF